MSITVKICRELFVCLAILTENKGFISRTESEYDNDFYFDFDTGAPYFNISILRQFVSIHAESRDRFFCIIFDVRLFWIVYSFACWLECIPSASRPILYGYKLERQALSTLKTWELLCTLIHRSGQVPEIDFFTCCKVHILMVLHYLLIE